MLNFVYMNKICHKIRGRLRGKIVALAKVVALKNLQVNLFLYIKTDRGGGFYA